MYLLNESNRPVALFYHEYVMIRGASFLRSRVARVTGVNEEFEVIY